MKNILVTGGAGFIGSHLVDRLLEEGGWQVTVVDDFNDFYSPEIKHANIVEHLKSSNYRLVDADIRDAAAMDAIFALVIGSCHLVFFLVGQLEFNDLVPQPLLIEQS